MASQSAMAALQTLVLTILMSLPRFYADTESDTERYARATILAQAMVEASAQATCTGDWATLVDCKPVWPASEQNQLVALLITQGFWESRFAQHIHADHCGPHECDPAKLPSGLVFHRARSVWQIHAGGSVSGSEWWQMSGDKQWPTFVAATAAARILALSRGRCGFAGNWELGTISAYAGSISCAWSKAGPRLSFYRMILGKLERPATQPLGFLSPGQERAYTRPRGARLPATGSRLLAARPRSGSGASSAARLDALGHVSALRATGLAPGALGDASDAATGPERSPGHSGVTAGQPRPLRGPRAALRGSGRLGRSLARWSVWGRSWLAPSRRTPQRLPSEDALGLAESH